MSGELPALRRRLEVTARLLRLAEEVAWSRRGDPEGLLAAAEFAATVAWVSHGGSFVLPGIEEALRGLRLGPSASVAPLARRVEGRTLHVVTAGQEFGGHTKLVRRWIESVVDDRQAVVLVQQARPIETSLLRPPGREVPVVDLLAEGLAGRVARAEALATMMRAAGRVILHIHPNDAVSVAAAHQAGGTDLRLLNHADHVAWLGAALPMTLLNLRGAGARLAALRRGIPEQCSDVLPIPLTHSPLPPRSQARAALGLPAGAVVLLTVASGYKFNAIGGRSLEAPLRLALRRPEVMVLAVGPKPSHPLFSRLAREFPGRVKAVGIVPDPALHRAAADFFFDSFPFCSPTAMLESALHGTPVLAYQPDFAAAEVLSSEVPGLPRQSWACDSAEGFAALLDDQLADPARRQAAAAAMALGLEPYLPEAWREALATLLVRSRAQPGWQAPPGEPQATTLDLLLAGLGQDPLRRPLLKWRVLGPRGPAAVLAERLRALRP